MNLAVGVEVPAVVAAKAVTAMLAVVMLEEEIVAEHHRNHTNACIFLIFRLGTREYLGGRAVPHCGKSLLPQCLYKAMARAVTALTAMPVVVVVVEEGMADEKDRNHTNACILHVENLDIRQHPGGYAVPHRGKNISPQCLYRAAARTVRTVARAVTEESVREAGAEESVGEAVAKERARSSMATAESSGTNHHESQEK